MVIDANTIEMFFCEIEIICRKYRLSISHQVTHCAFVIEGFDKDNIKWLREADKPVLYQQEGGE